jgi:hypothetical protein
LSAGVLVLFDVLGRFPEATRRITFPTQMTLIFVALALNAARPLLERRWKRLHPEAR